MKNKVQNIVFECITLFEFIIILIMAYSLFAFCFLTGKISTNKTNKTNK